MQKNPWIIKGSFACRMKGLRFHMNTKKIITVTLVSAGLILGATNTAFAVDYTSTATVTTTTYISQLTAYNTALTTFESATTTFKIRIAAYASAAQVYRASYSNALLIYKAILKAKTPFATTARSAVLMVAYNTAMTSYTTATATFKAQSSQYQAAVTRYKAAYQTISHSFKAVSDMREQLKKSINSSFNVSVHKANVAFATVKASARTDAEKSAAINVREGAVVAVVAVRKTALDGLGAKMVKPSKQRIEMGDKINSFKAVKPIQPIKSTHSEKSDSSGVPLHIG